MLLLYGTTWRQQHKTNPSTTESASKPLRANRRGLLRAELDLWAKVRIVSITDLVSMQDKLCNCSLTCNRYYRACDDQSCSRSLWESPERKFKLHHLFNLTRMWMVILLKASLYFQNKSWDSGILFNHQLEMKSRCLLKLIIQNQNVLANDAVYIILLQ